MTNNQQTIWDISGAEFSHCRQFRYALWRIWNTTKPFVMFIGLNPSTANETEPDPTIRRVCQFAKDWGYGGVYMMNLFPFVTAYPEELKHSANIDENNLWLIAISNKCRDIVFAWGSFEVFGRDEEIKKMFPKATCLGFNKNGSPKHQLYISAKTKQINFQ